MSKTDTQNKSRQSETGISLLEIMVVLAIIGLVVGLAAPRVIGSFGRAKSQVAEIQMASLKGALQLYYIDVGRYPSEAEGLNALLEQPIGTQGWNGPYLDSREETLDPWKRVFIYRQPGQVHPFSLTSLGRDGHAGGTKEDKDISTEG